LYISIAHSSPVNRPKKLWGCLLSPLGPAEENRSINPDNRFRSVSRFRSSCTTRPFTVGEFRRIGSSSLRAKGFIMNPSIRPNNIRGGRMSPNAIFIASEQWANICAGSILPHSRRLLGPSLFKRSLISFTLGSSKRFFIYKSITKTPLITKNVFVAWSSAWPVSPKAKPRRRGRGILMQV
jgi:hypothetical protein